MSDLPLKSIAVRPSVAVAVKPGPVTVVGGTGVSSFNGREGNVTLAESDVRPLVDSAYLAIPSNATANQVLIYDGANWLPANIPTVDPSGFVPKSCGTSYFAVYDGDIDFGTSQAHIEVQDNFVQMQKRLVGEPSYPAVGSVAGINVAESRDGSNTKATVELMGNIDQYHWGDASLLCRKHADARYVLQNSLPVATSTALGAIKVGANLSVLPDGTLNATGGGGGDMSAYVPIVSNGTANVTLDTPATTTSLTGTVVGYNGFRWVNSTGDQQAIMGLTGAGNSTATTPTMRYARNASGFTTLACISTGGLGSVSIQALRKNQGTETNISGGCITVSGTSGVTIDGSASNMTEKTSLVINSTGLKVTTTGNATTWTSASLLTQGYADTRYQPTMANVTVGDGQTFPVQTGGANVTVNGWTWNGTSSNAHYLAMPSGSTNGLVIGGRYDGSSQRVSKYHFGSQSSYLDIRAFNKTTGNLTACTILSTTPYEWATLVGGRIPVTLMSTVDDGGGNAITNRYDHLLYPTYTGQRFISTFQSGGQPTGKLTVLATVANGTSSLTVEADANSPIAWTANSILTQGYADTRYLPVATSETLSIVVNSGNATYSRLELDNTGAVTLNASHGVRQTRLNVSPDQGVTLTLAADVPMVGGSIMTRDYADTRYAAKVASALPGVVEVDAGNGKTLVFTDGVLTEVRTTP